MREDGTSETKAGDSPMNFWRWLHLLGPGWPDARGWIGVATFGLTIMVLRMVQVDKTLREDEFFKVIATAIVLTGFIQGVVGWAYSATKGGGELADSNARIAEQAATASTTMAAKTAAEPQDVNIVAQEKPVDVRDAPQTTPAPSTPEKAPDGPEIGPSVDFEHDAAPTSHT